MGARSTSSVQSFFDNFYRSGTDAVSPNIPPPELRASGGSTYFFNNKASFMYLHHQAHLLHYLIGMM